MQPQNPLLQSRLRQMLLATGIVLFLIFGGRAISQVNDPSFVYGKQRSVAISAPGTWQPPLLRPAAVSVPTAAVPQAAPNDTGTDSREKYKGSKKVRDRPTAAPVKPAD